MSQNKQQLVDLIKKLDSFDFKKLYPSHSSVQPWNNLDANDVKDFVQKIELNLKTIVAQPKVLDVIAPQHFPSLIKHLQNFIVQYQNNQIDSLNLDQITTQHHAPLNQLNAVNDNLRNFGVLSEIKIADLLEGNIPNLEAAGAIADNLVNESSEITDAITNAKQWLGTKRDVDRKTIDDQAEAFYDRAQKHKTLKGWRISGDLSKQECVKYFKQAMDHFPEKRLKSVVNLFKGFIVGLVTLIRFVIVGFAGSWFWLFASLFFALMALAFTFLLVFDVGALPWFQIKLADSSSGLGEALLRVTSLAVPGYLTLFCANQFLYHKRLYDNYMFKFSSLKTMNSLIATHKDRSERVLDKGLDVLFSEPKLKETSGKYDTQLMNEVLKMVRDQSR